MDAERRGSDGQPRPGTAARALRLLALLQAPHGADAAHLAAHLGVSRRTVRRDVEGLRALGYAVRSRPGPGAGYQLAPGNRVPPLVFDVEEVTALVTGLQVLEARTGAASASTAAAGPDGAGQADHAADAAARAMAKLVSHLPRALAARARAAALATEVLPSGAVTIDPATAADLAEAVATGGRVTFGYTDSHGRSSHRLVNPYRHVLGQGRWYLVGHDVDRADWRTFRLDRVSDLKRVPGVYASPVFPADSVGEWFASDFGRHTAHP